MSNQYNLSILEALFYDYLVAEKKSSVTIKNYRSDIKHFFSWFHHYIKPSMNEEETPSYLDLFIDNSSTQLIEDYKHYLLEAKVPLKTINRRLSAIRKLHYFCVIRGYLKVNYAASIPNVVISAQRILIEQPLKEGDREDLKKYLCNNLSEEKRSDVLKDVNEFFELWS